MNRIYLLAILLFCNKITFAQDCQVPNIVTANSQVIIGKKFTGSYKSFTVEEVIAQNEGFDHVSVTGAKESRIFNEELVNIKMKIIYKSVHDERWEYFVDYTLPNGSKTTKLD